jgi:PPK2 family polyphosphate:nucleotide phosphotransferase
MTGKQLVKNAKRILKPFRVTKGKDFRLKDVDPGDTLDFKSEDKAKVKETLTAGIQTLTRFQDKLYAQDRWGMLLIFQAMDAAGKDSAIKHVMSGLNPQSCQVWSFKAPSAEELDHDFLWRCAQRLPNRGHIGIFNRSYYEETLVVRVHRELLEKEKLPAGLVTKEIWKERFENIRSFEQYLTRNGIIVRKFFLHVSKSEQKKRFLERINDPHKNWKFSPQDIAERRHWDDYMKAYEEMIQSTATKESPWYVVPADHKWFTRLVVAAAVIEALGSLDVDYPKLGKSDLKELAKARKELERSE